MKLRLLAVLGFLCLMTTSCSEDSICDCIDAGEKFNQFTQKQLDNPGANIDTKEFKRLKDDKVKKCAEFQKMGGPEMLERKASCK